MEEKKDEKVLKEEPNYEALGTTKGKFVESAGDIKISLSANGYRQITCENDAGKVVAKLYVNDNGNLHPDSWLRDENWFAKENKEKPVEKK